MADEKGLRHRTQQQPQQQQKNAPAGVHDDAVAATPPMKVTTAGGPSFVAGGNDDGGPETRDDDYDDDCDHDDGEKPAPPDAGPVMRFLRRRQRPPLCLGRRTRVARSRAAAAFVRRRRPFAAFLVVLSVVVILVGPAVRWLYRTYKDETEPSPFLDNSGGGGGKTTRIRGTPPPSGVFEFPTPMDRVVFYMGEHWYRYNNSNHDGGDYDDDIAKTVCSDVAYWRPGMGERGAPYRFDADNLQALTYTGWPFRLPWRYDRGHPADAYRYHFALVDGDGEGGGNGGDGNKKKKQMLLQFGDGKDSAAFLSTPYPLVVKTRLVPDVYEARFGSAAATTDASSSSSSSPPSSSFSSSLASTPPYPPIIGMYEIHRHYNDHFRQVDDLWDVIPWSAKKEALVWRGASSGRRREVMERYFGYGRHGNGTKSNNTGRRGGPVEIDVAFSYTLDVHGGRLDHLVRESLTVPELLTHKYLLALEGWCMASGLKWMLYSNSVVFMAPPTKVSWAMECLLVPWVHYVPLVPDGSDLPEKLEWARTHDEDCQRISLQARDYMERLVTSDQAREDTVTILKEMDRAYQQNFGALMRQCADDDYGRGGGGIAVAATAEVATPYPHKMQQ